MPALNTTRLISEIEQGKPAKILFHYHTEEILKSIDGIFARLLGKMDIIFLLDAIVTVIREIIVNAIKANSKRLHFEELHLDITNPESYEKGMNSFKDEALDDTKGIEQKLKKSDYRASLSITRENQGLKIKVTNNAGIHPKELDRINLRIEKAKKYSDFTDAYDEIHDDSEGAGLGIVLTILLLKNSGLGEDPFKIESSGRLTTSQFEIPFQLKPRKITTQIKEQILKEINGLPSFNPHIVELQKMCYDSKSTIDSIVKKTMIDPALTSDILRLSNSAGFITGKRIEKLDEAVMIIGLKNLHDILIATVSRKILETRYPKFGEIWKHCNKTAAYAHYIAVRCGLKKNADKTFLGGLLHDLGKLILLSVDTKFSGWISNIVKDRKIRTATVIEEVSLGISHSRIGSSMAERWSFPDYLIQAIQFHHSPLSAGKEFRDIVYPVYLANMFCGIETGKYHIYYLEEMVLERLGIHTETEITAIHKELKELIK